MTFPAVLLIANLAATWLMVGLIWFVQVVHYPQFAGVGADAFAAYHRRHTRFTTFVVGPPMLVEAATAVALVLWPPAGAVRWALWAGLAVVALLWASTAWLQVPRHNELARGFDPAACRSLCRGNWLRTAGWTLRGLLMAYVAAGLVR